MKKSKLLLVSILAVVLCIVSVMSSASTTFSWFTRPKSLTGDKLQLPGQTYEIANGKNISFVTYESTDGGENYGSTPVTNFSNSALAPHTRKMYRTDVTNSGSDPQSISLFLNNLEIGSGDGRFYLGVNNPLKTYKPYGINMQTSSTSKGVKTNNNTMRVYFQPKDINNDWKNKTYVIHYGNGNTNSASDMEATATSGTYFKDIPTTTTQIYFSVKNTSNSWERTQTFTDVKNDGLSDTNSLVFWLTGSFDSGGYNNAQADKASVNGANIVTYYKTITVTVGQTFPAALIADTEYIGDIKYYDDDTHLNVMTADEETGLITAKAVGTSKLYTKVTGPSFGDAMQMETEVKVVAATTVGSDTYEFAPVVTNVRIPGASADGTSVESIFWYIKNDSDTTLSYTIESLDITL